MPTLTGSAPFIVRLLSLVEWSNTQPVFRQKHPAAPEMVVFMPPEQVLLQNALWAHQRSKVRSLDSSFATAHGGFLITDNDAGRRMEAISKVVTECGDLSDKVFGFKQVELTAPELELLGHALVTLGTVVFEHVNTVEVDPSTSAALRMTLREARTLFRELEPLAERKEGISWPEWAVDPSIDELSRPGHEVVV